MIANLMKQLLSMLVCSTLLVAETPAEALQEQTTSAGVFIILCGDRDFFVQRATPTAPAGRACRPRDQLNSLVAPIARSIQTRWLLQVLAADHTFRRGCLRRGELQQNPSLTGSAQPRL